MNTAITKCTLLALFGVGLGFISAPTPSLAQSTWRMNLSELEIIRQREASGDRPYFAIIQFRSRFGTRGSTQVNVISHEPHDWVSKPALRGTLPSGRDHMFAGERTTLPFWMREIEWRNLNQVSDPRVDGRLDPARLEAALRMDVVGVVIVGLDNNNTPPPCGARLSRYPWQCPC
ncbi:MAG: hypothetical protein HC810_00195 [Acaryochloridaceae cyanobacterium RL_2_7]|nr:hypothetical protein [Acaryochloridaceae cyanobacterium RL_2_7]